MVIIFIAIVVIVAISSIVGLFVYFNRGSKSADSRTPAPTPSIIPAPAHAPFHACMKRLACMQAIDPVCGADGVTYDNTCMATRYCIDQVTKGACSQSDVSKRSYMVTLHTDRPYDINAIINDIEIVWKQRIKTSFEIQQISSPNFFVNVTASPLTAKYYLSLHPAVKLVSEQMT